MNKKAILSRNYMKMYRTLHKENNAIVFKSFDNQFSDSPRFIAQKLHELAIKQNKKIRMYWIVNDKEKCRKNFPDYIMLIDDKSLEKFEVVSSAKVWVDNCTKNSTQYKADDQFYIQTWHGDRGFKKIGAMANKLPKDFENAPVFDLAMAGSDYGEEKYRKAFYYKGEITKYGLPRNDILINKDEEFCKKVREKLKISPNTGILLYAPTFRDTKQNEKQSLSGIDINRTLYILEQKTDKKWICLLRAHHLIKEGFSCLGQENVKDVSSYDDICDLMAISDMLITDYSSCAGDFILTGKPVILYCADLDEYIATSRELAFDIKSSPYMVATKQSELENLIYSLNPEKAKENDEQLKGFYGCTETGDSARRICELIMSKLEE